MENLRGAALMTAAMACFALEDMFIKLMASAMPVGQILILLGTGGALIFAALTRATGARVFDGALRHPAVQLRCLGELIGTMGFVTAIALTPISSASAILQATPLVVTLGAALFLGAEVGWRRWTAIAVGFVGVLLIIRPGAADFEPLSLFALQGVFGLAIRDLATRRVPADISSMQLSTYAFATVIPAGVAMMAAMGQGPVLPDAGDWGYLAGALTIGVMGYYWIVGAMRIGDIAFVTPFRYSRLVFALFVGIFVFSENPDALTYLGATIIVGSGLYTLLREAQAARRRPAASLSRP
ncbi:DMT family transporter [Aestuariibius sp. 2305UL40-4]|uniref:DMT family transporter n=1 Tax=Aestuariibius violaceus TaxID=3234132 RepID=UPI00345E3F75